MIWRFLRSRDDVCFQACDRLESGTRVDRDFCLKSPTRGLDAQKDLVVSILSPFSLSPLYLVF